MLSTVIVAVEASLYKSYIISYLPVKVGPAIPVISRKRQTDSQYRLNFHALIEQLLIRNHKQTHQHY